jgi:hypothetical protein
MGLLDEAIREHLELKRRRGADASEISRQESDALGPVRRSPEGVPDLSDVPAFEDPDAAAEPDVPAMPEAPAAWEAETTVHTPPLGAIYDPPPLPPVAAAPSPPPAVHEAPSVPSAPPVADEPPDVADEPPTAVEDQPPDEPTHPSLLSRLNPTGRMRHLRREHGEEPPAPLPPPDEPPSNHEPDIVPADDEPEGEELLEETPEFLEETPEHDRLWFEQRPPRDFNFDD